MSHLGRSGTLLDPPNTLVSIFHSPVLTWCVCEFVQPHINPADYPVGYVLGSWLGFIIPVEKLLYITQKNKI